MRRRDFIALVGTAIVAGNRNALAQSSSKIYRLAVISPQGQVPQNPIRIQSFFSRRSPSAVMRFGRILIRGPARRRANRSPSRVDGAGENQAGGCRRILGLPGGARRQGSRHSDGRGLRRRRSGGDRPRRQSCAAGRQHHRHFGRCHDAYDQAPGAAQGVACRSSSRVAMLWNKDDLGMSLRYDASAQVAQSIGITVQALGVRAPDDFNEAFAAMDREPPDAILMVSDSLTTLNRKRVFDFAAAATPAGDLRIRFPGPRRRLDVVWAGPDRSRSSAPAPWSTASSRAPSQPICRSSNRRAIRS